MVKGEVLEAIYDPETIRYTISKLAKVEDVRLVRNHDDKLGNTKHLMRDFAFVEFASIAESKKVLDFASKNGLIIQGGEVKVSYCRDNRPKGEVS